ncbi:G2/mitotic-specific cyclin-B-like [Liolophura sinensis]|uniref:G2/mitotic-specific cyclin-B-like n=1 Tax=Liolophura sinensis TaxID=3198878 RepID=UPI00315973F1
MALATRSNSAALHTSNNQKTVLSENPEAVGKGMVTKAAFTRSALGDIANKVNNQTTEQGKRTILKKDGTIVTKHRPIGKSKATTSLLKAADQDIKSLPVQDAQELPDQIAAFSRTMGAITVEDVEPEPVIPAPMDISEDKAEAFSRNLRNVEDIDANDRDNPQLVSEYVNEIYDYMRSLERRFSVKEDYLNGREISGKMRAILIDWLCQVHHRFHLLQETLYLTVSIIDRFLQVYTVNRRRLQLVGVTAMLIASKYEEMFAPQVADFVYITDNAYREAEIRSMEALILKTLDFSFGKPLCLHFLRRNSKAGQVDAMKHTLAKYLMELTIIDYDMVSNHPSEIAAAALCMSIRLIDGSEWTDTLVHYSGYTEDEVLPVMKKIAGLVVKSESSRLSAVKTKYQSSKFMKISTIAELQSNWLKELAAEE